MVLLARVNTVMTGLPGSPWFSSQWFADAETLPEQAAVAVHTFWNTVKTVMASGTTIQVQPEVQLVEHTTGQVVGTYTKTQVSISTTSSAAVLPLVCQGLIRLNTNTWSNGRQVRGHIYVPGMGASTMDVGGKMTTSVQTILKDAARAMTTTAGNPPQLVYSRTRRLYFAVVETPAQAKFAVLRSRRD